MTKPPRKHHVISSFYLAGFTADGGKDGKLHVLDKKRLRTWVSTPSDTARHTDFYKFEIDDLDPMGIETALGKVEGRCSQVLRDISLNQKLPTNEDFDVLLNFVAISAVRVPSFRETLSDFNNRVLKDLSRLNFGGREGLERLKRTATSAGKEMTDADARKLQDFIASDDYTIDLDQNWHVRTMLESVNTLLPLLAQRNWSLWLASSGLPDMVCSDRPVALMFHQPTPPLLSPGFGTPNTMLTMPLNRRMDLASCFEDIPQHYEMDRDDIAFVNTLTGLWANQIYSPAEDWIWTAKLGHRENKCEYLEGLQRQSHSA